MLNVAVREVFDDQMGLSEAFVVTDSWIYIYIYIYISMAGRVYRTHNLCNFSVKVVYCEMILFELLLILSDNIR